MVMTKFPCPGYYQTGFQLRNASRILIITVDILIRDSSFS